MPIVEVTTNNHLGDAVILTAAMKYASRYGVKFRYRGNYGEVFNGLPFMTVNPRDQFNIDLTGEVSYTGYSQRTANGGTCAEGFTRNLCRLCNIPPPSEIEAKDLLPVLAMTSAEYAYSRQFNDKWLLNANWQTCSLPKAYPHWQKVIDGCKGIPFFRIGGKEERDRSFELVGVKDYRGKTSVRQLIAAVFGCKGVVSPPSAVVHIAAAFGRPVVCLTGAREPVQLTAYPTVQHLTSTCGKYDSKHGCMAFRDCGRFTPDNFAECMSSIPPDDVSAIIKEIDAGEY